MAFGLEVRDASGVLIVDVGRRLGRVIGRFNTGTSNGSFTFSGSVSGTFWAATLDAFYGAPSLTLSGTTISWTFPNPGLITPRNTAVVYGSF
jgi:cytochrome c2